MSRRWIPLVVFALLSTALPASAQGRRDRRVDVAFEDATLPQLVRFVAHNTGRRFLLTGPQRNLRVSIISQRPVTLDELWDGFLAVLAQNGLTAVQTGPYYRIVEVEGIEGRDTPVVPDGQATSAAGAPILRIFQLESGSVEDVAALLRNFSSPGGTITAYAPTRMLLVNDTVQNIERMRLILQHSLPARADSAIYVERLQHADADEIAQTLSQLTPVSSAP
ncbi:MAG: hypothetical protein H6719_23270 [Sandaracinaceae bacterium]|nr:hypothetical protein [Sandaracinaceae bacterium]